MAEIIELTSGDNNLYLQIQIQPIQIQHPDHGSDAQKAIVVTR